MNNFFFIGLPYLVIAIFLIGTIFKYIYTSYKYSTLSSQLLEDNTLFYGTRPFHWGIMFLFTGHLTGLLFPSSVLAWNGQTMRLLIIEIAAFGFALTTLYGLTILIFRRLLNKRIKIVTSKMDYVVYIILLIQIISGLWVAYFHRWGTSWFASVMSPYLKSVLLFSPDTAAVNIAPLSVKIHIISAFSIIGIVPFTRLVHFLVYPFRYFYRGYILVIWNRNQRKMRVSANMREGKKPRNN
ncbi:MAG: respiratory nitrate reductase subunit gamma [Bacteroidetes bacterium GWA2_30_7]|nr:MAG: respiratory nitrate reductase subunit gamma [Bacteroidetes bacterium GWA2_30_7]